MVVMGQAQDKGMVDPREGSAPRKEYGGGRLGVGVEQKKLRGRPAHRLAKQSEACLHAA